ncbi:zinc ABC transporter substrate-binding protein [Iamia sp. SCSIO 61187]|uniref:metal ABC transporter substrate-binding protein n=1 Tax=Iamia sp. SCSIO 61187 TaxID=2722752 RepID=UPI001C63279A|nr:metal ABC transporter substrate-binding protein [Iamia sp. SCSIO 61187]QYG92471.1 zinc ABC transporter substrate-binding protein [Iamia sp. SCSIO 61187]
MRSRPTLALIALALLVAAACGSEDATADDGRPTVVATTSILGDVVSEVVGDAARVVVVMPAGADPHDFQPSAQQVNQIRSADALVTNGGGFEVGLLATLESAEGDVPTIHALDTVDALTFGATAPEEVHADDAEGHEDEEEAEEGAPDPHAHDGDDDPHFFTDPDRVADAAEGIAAFLADEVPALATDEVADHAAAYVDELRALAAEVEETLAPIPPERRVIITNHEVFGYFADRYDFEVVGAVVPGGGTGAEPSAAELDDLAHLIEEEGVPAIFADASSPARLADALAAEVGGDVEVVSLFTESLGEEGSGAETYAGLVRTNAERIAEALG